MGKAENAKKEALMEKLKTARMQVDTHTGSSETMTIFARC
jgi:hypothetical protein